MEEGFPVRGPSNVDEIREKAPLEVAAAPILQPNPADIEPSRKMLPDRVLLSTYVPLQERIHHPTGKVAPDAEGALNIIHHWSPFN